MPAGVTSCGALDVKVDAGADGPVDIVVVDKGAVVGCSTDAAASGIIEK